MRPQTEPSMEPLWAWHGKTKKQQQQQENNNNNNNKQTDKQTNEKEQDKHQYKNNKLQCKYYLISGPLFTIPCQKDLSLSCSSGRSSIIQTFLDKTFRCIQFRVNKI